MYSAFAVRFQWISSQGDPWWLPDINDERQSNPQLQQWFTNSAQQSRASPQGQLVGRPAIPKPYRCIVCGVESPRIYCIQKFCFNDTCTNFFIKLNKNYEAMTLSNLDYSNWVLTHHACFETDGRVPYQLSPSQTLQNLDQVGDVNPDLRGVYCTECGRLSCRIYWDRFTCGTCNVSRSRFRSTIRQASPKLG